MKSDYIRIRISEQEKDNIRARAESLQMTMSEYLIYLARLDRANNEA